MMENCKISQEKCKRIIDIVKDTAVKMSDPAYVKRVVSDEGNSIYIEGNKICPWGDISLSDGYSAVGVLFGELNNIFPEESWDLTGHKYMLELQNVINTQRIDSFSLFGGLCSIGFAAVTLSCGGKRYQKLIEAINEFIVQSMPAKLNMVASAQKATDMNDYDVIQGFSGIGRYLLFFADKPQMKGILQDILKYMVSLTEDINVLGHSVPRWYISRENQFIQNDKNLYINGSFNFGMSHGITGPLAFMSIALLHGIEINGQREAIEKIVSTLNAFKFTNLETINWPGRIKFEEFIDKTCIDRIERASWCYGTPGIARAIYLAGKALGNENYKELAVNSLESILSLPEEAWFLESPTFCHGYAGLLKIAECMYIDTGLESFMRHCDYISNKIMGFYNENAPFNFYNIEYDNLNEENKLREYSSCGLLGGTAGILLALLGVVNPGVSNWDNIFLIN